MLIPMILEPLALDFNDGTAILDPTRRLLSIAGHQAMDIPNPLAFGNHARLGLEPAR
jgi:hypothetical protein